MSKVAIYTVLTNDYDMLAPASVNIPHYVFTDNPGLKCNGWETILIKKTEDQRLQRKLKILIPQELDNYDTVVYIDANMSFKPTFINVLRNYRGGFLVASHPERKCVYDEGLTVKKLKKAEPKQVNNQIAEYYQNDFPVNFGMWATGFMIRDKSTARMCEIWHEKLLQHTHRDQLSLPWALWKTSTKAKEVPLLKMVNIRPHKKKEPIKVYYSTPFDLGKNIGKANNDFISLLPDESWVCITDGDALWLRPDWGKCVNEVIANNSDYGLIGCLTNRLGGLHQCYNNEFSRDNDVSNHYEIANNLWNENGFKVEETKGIAGLCMIFSKETWKIAGGFKENIITADTEFNNDVRKLGLKIGLAKGLYMFHGYRIWEKEHKRAWASTNHLK